MDTNVTKPSGISVYMKAGKHLCGESPSGSHHWVADVDLVCRYCGERRAMRYGEVKGPGRIRIGENEKAKDKPGNGTNGASHDPHPDPV